MYIKWAQKKFIVIIVVDKKNDHINKFTLIFKIKFVDHLFGNNYSIRFNKNKIHAF